MTAVLHYFTWGSVHGERANFTGSVLCCIDASDSESRLIFQHFSSSTRLAHLCTAPNAKFCKIFANFFCCCKISWFFSEICKISSFLCSISMKFAQNFAIFSPGGELLNIEGFPEVFPRFSRNFPYVIQFFPGPRPPQCGLLATNFERMPAAALRDHGGSSRLHGLFERSCSCASGRGFRRDRSSTRREFERLYPEADFCNQIYSFFNIFQDLQDAHTSASV